MTDAVEAREQAWQTYRFDNWINEQRDPYKKATFLAGFDAARVVALEAEPKGRTEYRVRWPESTFRNRATSGTLDSLDAIGRVYPNYNRDGGVIESRQVSCSPWRPVVSVGEST
jgi:hypothetical protein